MTDYSTATLTITNIHYPILPQLFSGLEKLRETVAILQQKDFLVRCIIARSVTFDKCLYFMQRAVCMLWFGLPPLTSLQTN